MCAPWPLTVAGHERAHSVGTVAQVEVCPAQRLGVGTGPMDQVGVRPPGEETFIRISGQAAAPSWTCVMLLYAFVAVGDRML